MKHIQVPTPQRHALLEFLFPDIRRMREEIEHDRITNFQAVGFTHIAEFSGLTVNLATEATTYNLRSWDGGQNWYACDVSKENGLKILGPVDEVYPGLRETLNYWDKLVALATR